MLEKATRKRFFTNFMLCVCVIRRDLIAVNALSVGVSAEDCAAALAMEILKRFGVQVTTMTVGAVMKVATDVVVADETKNVKRRGKSKRNGSSM